MSATLAIVIASVLAAAFMLVRRKGSPTGGTGPGSRVPTPARHDFRCGPP